jgi:flagellin
MAVINTNLLSLTTQNNLNKSQSSLGTAIERLSSGLRINSAKDDAAGQAIANRMTAQIKGMTRLRVTPTTVSPWRRLLKVL